MADIVTNHKARRDYHVIETFEAGLVLHGTEVKSLRAGKGQIADAFARIDLTSVPCSTSPASNVSMTR